MPPPSITTWNRLEPRPRASDLAEALAARVRDPAWLLARQWQLGEFAGEDGGTPAYVRVQARVGQLGAWAPTDGQPREFDHLGPVEAYVTSEPFSPDDLGLAVELGQAFERLLDDVHASGLRLLFRTAYPVGDVTQDETPLAARLRGLWRGRAINGVALWSASGLSPSPPPPAGLSPTPAVAPGVPWTVPPADRAAAAEAIARFRDWVVTTYGAPGTEDPLGWRAPTLDYALRVHAADPDDGGVAVLSAKPDRRGDFDWYGFERIETAPGDVGRRAILTAATIPSVVGFRGMPNRRFWDFEDSRFDLAAIRTDPRGLASMLLLDFMLVHGNDWYVVPFELPVGTLTTSSVWVVDVFNETHPVAQASAAGDPEDGRFAMFSLSGPAGGFVLPVSAATSVLEGAPIEQVRFLRDEVANLGWAIEHVFEGSLGGGDRSADRPPPELSSVAPTSADAALRYRLQSAVPPNWIPLQPVLINRPRGEIALEQAALLSPSGDAPAIPSPRGKILRPTPLVPPVPYRIREEQIPREGTRVSRLVRRARGADGTTHVWIARTRGIGTGEGSSGLAFDQALAVTPPPEPTD